MHQHPEYYCKPTSFDDPVLKQFDIRLNRQSHIDFKRFTIGRHSKINGILHAKGGGIRLGQFIAGGV